MSAPDFYLVRLRSSDKIHRSTCIYAKRRDALRWLWVEANPDEDWATTAPWLKRCLRCLPPSPYAPTEVDA